MRFILVLTVPLATWAAWGAPAQHGHPITPDAELQLRIKRTAEALADGTLSPVQQDAEVGKLRDVAENDPKSLFRQVLYYASHDDTREDLALAAMAIYAHFRIDNATIVDVIVPYIDTEHRPLQELVRLALDGVEGYTATRAPDFSWYRGVLSRKAENPPAAIVRHMFHRDASEALREFTIVYGMPPARAVSPADPAVRQLRWADHIVNHAIKNAEFLAAFSKAPGGARPALVTLEKLSREEAGLQLDNLSKSDDWWVRLYVAEILRQHPAFRTPELASRLASDKHPLVREAMSFATAKPAPTPSTAGTGTT